MRRFFVASLMLMFAVESLSAQMRRPRVYTTNDPDWWVSAGVGGFRGNGVNDGVTASSWDFGNATNIQYRASLEKAVASGASFGIAGSYARVPFTYSSSLTQPLPLGESGTRCSSCNAHLDMTTLVVGLHSGSGIGFHQIVELNGGVAMYSNLKEDAVERSSRRARETSIRSSRSPMDSGTGSATPRILISFLRTILSPYTSGRAWRTVRATRTACLRCELRCALDSARGQSADRTQDVRCL